MTWLLFSNQRGSSTFTFLPFKKIGALTKLLEVKFQWLNQTRVLLGGGNDTNWTTLREVITAGPRAEWMCIEIPELGFQERIFQILPVFLYDFFDVIFFRELLSFAVEMNDDLGSHFQSFSFCQLEFSRSVRTPSLIYKQKGPFLTRFYSFVF